MRTDFLFEGLTVIGRNEFVRAVIRLPALRKLVWSIHPVNPSKNVIWVTCADL